MGSPETCLVPECGFDISSMSRYHRRHRVCYTHLRALAVNLEGTQQRFCQQCGRFQPLSDFNGDRRSCRVALRLHNSRRRMHTKHSRSPRSRESDDSTGVPRSQPYPPRTSSTGITRPDNNAPRLLLVPRRVLQLCSASSCQSAPGVVQNLPSVSPVSGLHSANSSTVNWPAGSDSTCTVELQTKMSCETPTGSMGPSAAGQQSQQPVQPQQVLLAVQQVVPAVDLPQQQQHQGPQAPQTLATAGLCTAMSGPMMMQAAHLLPAVGPLHAQAWGSNLVGNAHAGSSNSRGPGAAGALGHLTPLQPSSMAAQAAQPCVFNSLSGQASQLQPLLLQHVLAGAAHFVQRPMAPPGPHPVAAQHLWQLVAHKQSQARQLVGVKVEPDSEMQQQQQQQQGITALHQPLMLQQEQQLEQGAHLLPQPAAPVSQQQQGANGLQDCCDKVADEPLDWLDEFLTDDDDVDTHLANVLSAGHVLTAAEQTNHGLAAAAAPVAPPSDTAEGATPGAECPGAMAGAGTSHTPPIQHATFGTGHPEYPEAAARKHQQLVHPQFGSDGALLLDALELLTGPDLPEEQVAALFESAPDDFFQAHSEMTSNTCCAGQSA